MAANDRPQIYLVTPPDFDPDAFSATLAAVLDTVDVACIRLAMSSKDADQIGRAADALRLVAHDRDVALVIDSHLRLVERHGLDGVHLADGARNLREARKALGADAIVGAFCGTSRHDGMTAAEAGADYISFGPAGGLLGAGALAERDLFAWWSEMIEVPVVAEGGITRDLLAGLAPVTDFLAVGDEIWGKDNPASALRDLVAGLG
ncbi:MAG: thiamine phosphate synthase [Rhodobacteraceae bacterium]|nr:thiamine phosphate synthase [Paracoccaceae bacterium]